MKKIFLASVLLCSISSVGFAGDTTSSSISVSEGKGCESSWFKPKTIGDGGVTLTFTDEVNVCHKSSGEVYRFSTPDAELNSDVRGKALILFAVGANERECKSRLTPSGTKYKVSIRVKPGDKKIREITATGNGQFVKPGQGEACARIIRYQN